MQWGSGHVYNSDRRIVVRICDVLIKYMEVIQCDSVVHDVRDKVQNITIYNKVSVRHENTT